MTTNRNTCLAGAVLTAPLLLALIGHSAEPAKKSFTADEVAFYEKQVLPILQEHCFKCHSDKKRRGNLRLDSRAAVLKGGDLGPAVLLDRAEASPLVNAINYRDKLEMPPAGKLPQAKIDVLTRWVKMGLPSPAEKEPVARAPEHKPGVITEADRGWWAYRPLARPPVPQVKDTSWARNAIDAFVLAKVEAAGLGPAPPADRVALARRLYYDLTGLPPTPEEIDAFAADRSADAYERLVDRLLASPAYGEKWGRHWLDLVRFAETHGYERDSVKPFAWRYRDYVIGSFNADKPYDRFVKEQIAGDELDEPTPESVIATGYYRLGLWDDEPADREQARYDALDGIVSTTGQVVLGMTVGCARCHDHKRDPIPQRDYYRLLAFFQDVTDMNQKNTRKVVTPEDRRRHQEALQAKQAREGKLYQELYAIEQRFLREAGGKGLVPAGLVGSDLTDLTYRFYRDTWEKLPDFDSVKPEETGVVASNHFSLTPASRQEAVGLVFEGKLKVPEKGAYTFELASSEGARLLIDGKVVIDRPSKGRHAASGKLSLSAGLVPVRLEYFNGYARPQLQLAWSGPGVARRLLSEESSAGSVLVPDSRQEGTEWAYQLAFPGRGWMHPDFSDAQWKKGKGGFGTRGTPGAVVRTRWDGKAIFLRKSFEVESLPAGLVLDLHHDDDVAVYLNGTPIYRAKGYLTAYSRVPLGEEAVKALRKGSNVLAVQCRQTTGGQYIDVGLSADSAANIAALIRRHGPEVLGEDATRRHTELSIDLDRSRQAPVPEPGLEVMCVTERGRAETRVLIRGNPHAPGDVVTPGVPEVLTRGEAKLQVTPTPDSSGKRRALAEWLTGKDNPMTARVLANRLWQHHFGRGIVPTSSDFGKLGELPTHPELLDWLAAELLAGEWRIKRLHRLILTSNAYRMSSKGSPEALAKDPANTLFWRCNMRRLTAEEIRDSMLSVSGQLNRDMAGPGVYPTIPRAVLAGQSRPGDGWGKSPPHEQARRSVYIHIKRSLVVPILESHDLADTDNSCAVRYTTTVPTQALAMLNGEFTNEQATALAERLTGESGDLAAQVRWAIRLTTGRRPTDEEVRHDVAFVKGLLTKDRDAAAALRLYCLLALNANEFMYLD